MQKDLYESVKHIYGDLGVDEVLVVLGAAEKAQQIAGSCCVVVVDGEIIDNIVALVQDFLIPLREVFHEGRGGAADRCLNGRVDPLHGFTGFLTEDAVSSRILLPGAELPVAIHLVSEIPGVNAVRFFVAVFAAQIRPVGAAFVIRVFDDIHGILHRAGAEVYGVERRDAGFLRPLKVFVVTDFISDVLVPCRIEVDLSLVLRTDGVFPLPGRDEVAARKTYSRKTGLFQCFDKVSTEALLIGGLMLRVIHGAVDHGSDRFKKSTEQSRGDLSDREIRMNGDSCTSCHMGPPLDNLSFGSPLRSGDRCFSRRIMLICQLLPVDIFLIHLRLLRRQTHQMVLAIWSDFRKK